MTEPPCENCASLVKTLQLYIGDKPTRLIWVDRHVATRTPSNYWLESWTEHTPDRCRSARMNGQVGVS